MPIQLRRIMRSIIVVNICLAFAAAIVIYCMLPARVAVHADISHHVDRWGGKWELFVPAIITAVLQWLFYAFWKLIYSINGTKTAEKLLLWSCAAVSAILSAIATGSAFGSYSFTLHGTPPKPAAAGLIFAIHFLFSAALLLVGKKQDESR